MPMGIVNDSEFESEVVNSNAIPSLPTITNPTMTPPTMTGVVIDNPTKGRGNGNIQVPEPLRKIIGETAITDGRQTALDLANSFGISPSSVSAYAKGSHSTANYNEGNPDLRTHINGVKERISKKARNKLSLALKHITEEKLESAKPEVLSGVAKDMSAIIKNMEPEPVKQSNPDGGQEGPKFVFFAPTFVKEEHFETIQAKE